MNGPAKFPSRGAGGVGGGGGGGGGESMYLPGGTPPPLGALRSSKELSGRHVGLSSRYDSGELMNGGGGEYTNSSSSGLRVERERSSFDRERSSFERERERDALPSPRAPSPQPIVGKFSRSSSLIFDRERDRESTGLGGGGGGGERSTESLRSSSFGERDRDRERPSSANGNYAPVSRPVAGGGATSATGMTTSSSSSSLNYRGRFVEELVDAGPTNIISSPPNSSSSKRQAGTPTAGMGGPVAGKSQLMRKSTSVGDWSDRRLVQPGQSVTPPPPPPPSASYSPPRAAQPLAPASAMNLQSSLPSSTTSASAMAGGSSGGSASSSISSSSSSSSSSTLPFNSAYGATVPVIAIMPHLQEVMHRVLTQQDILLHVMSCLGSNDSATWKNKIAAREPDQVDVTTEREKELIRHIGDLHSRIAALSDQLEMYKSKNALLDRQLNAIRNEEEEKRIQAADMM